MTNPVIHWFRRDLRLQDNTALHAALRTGQPVVPLFIFDTDLQRSPRVGAPRMAFLLDALTHLDASLRAYGTRLILRTGQPHEILAALIDEVGAEAVFANRDHSPYARRRDDAVEKALRVPLHRHDDVMLIPPDALLKADGKPYTVYTPYRNKWNTLAKAALSDLTLKDDMFHPMPGIASEDMPTMQTLGFGATIDLPEASEAAAHRFLDEFAARDLPHYATTRNNLVINPFDRPRPVGTSYLSPYLRLGLLSPRHAYHKARDRYVEVTLASERDSIEKWVSELAWRDFYIQIMYHFPQVLERNFKEQYDSVQWENDPAKLQAWQDGRTGYPVVDAAMRQMSAIGWMPNRARMITASFLCKDLLVHWQPGDYTFMQHLIDGDPAANNGGWQWVAGTGTDAQPIYRIFNPVTQSEKFATPEYLRHWLPELRDVSDKDIHAPWLSPRPPADYPRPIVDHAQARAQTLAAFKNAGIALQERDDA